MKEHLFSVTKKDFTITTFRGSGKGGQHRNKTDSAVRIVHNDSGAVGESQSERSQLTNKKIALYRLSKTPKFKLWLTRKMWEINQGKTVGQKVTEMMDEKNLKIEFGVGE